MRASVPLAEGSLSGFLEVPLVAESYALRFERKCDGIAELDGLVCGLCGDFQILRNGDFYRVGLNRLARRILYNAVKLNAVPCGVGRDGFTGMGAVIPLAE